MRSTHLPLIPALLLGALPALAADDFPLRWRESGIGGITGGYRPQMLMLAEASPAGIKHAPDGLHMPRYTSFTLGPKDAPATVFVIVDEADGKPDHVYVDANANGDLTDDQALELKATPSLDPENGEAMTYEAQTMVNLPFASGMKMGRIKFSQVRCKSKFDGMFRKSLSYYSDYGWAGDLTIGGKSIPAALSDGGAIGDFRFDNNISLTPLLWLGIPSGPKQQIGATFVASKPFEVDGKWWVLTDLAPDGHFKIAASAKPADANPAKPFVKQSGPDLSPGKMAPAFAGKLLGGKEIRFPDDYKGKIVMLDFWATWCGPCVREIPNVIAAYQKFHGQGFEVLGISLDKAADAQKLAAFTEAKAMPWPQVFDGKFWDAEVSKLYGVHAVPYMILIDGDTGLVIESDLAGADLAKTVGKALAAPNGPPPAYFEKLDKNHDGRISLEEFYPTGPPPLHPRMKQVFESFDKDHTGTLSFADAAKTIATVSGVMPKLIADTAGDWSPVKLDVHPRTKRAFVKATIHGVEGTFLLDAGTTDTILHPDFARRAGVDFVEICQTITAGNMGKHGDSVTLVRVPDLILGGTHFRDFHAVLQSSKQATYEFGKAIDGLIGSSIIYAKPVTLDFGKGLMTWQPLPAVDGGWVFPLHKDAKVALTDADVDGVKIKLMMDSGAAIGNTIMINEPYHEAIRKLAGDPKAVAYRAKSISIGGQVIAKDQRCLLRPFEYSVFSSEFFGSHVISVDLAAGKAVIK